jgi:hypothetical protein
LKCEKNNQNFPSFYENMQFEYIELFFLFFLFWLVHCCGLHTCDKHEITAKKTLNNIFANKSMLHMHFKFMSMSESGGWKGDGTWCTFSKCIQLGDEKEKKKWVPINILNF